MTPADAIDTPHARKIEVGLGARSYDVIVGEDLIDNAAQHIEPFLQRRFVAIVTDENVAATQSARLRASLDTAKIAYREIVLPAGEATKSFAHFESLLSQLLSAGVERRDIVIALGGGVIGDITGFASAVLRRGCHFIQIPTSLLAQVDSSVGGKTAINAREGKNLIGVFHQPALVLADISSLGTLPLRERRAGYAEVVKYGALGDASFFDWLETNGEKVLNGDHAALTHAISTSVEAKARIVAADEREGGVRALLNLGHTFGHALEAAFGFSERLLHGEAVAAGMGLAFDYSASEGLCASADAERLKTHLRKSGLPACIGDIDGAADFSAEALLELMKQDKKVVGGKLTLILARGIGEAFIKEDADIDRLRAFLKTAGAS